jgi:hypothetical protein
LKIRAAEGKTQPSRRNMANELITAIKKVNDLNYLSNDYKSPINEFRKILKEYEKRVSVKIVPEIAEFIVFVNGKMFYDWVVFKSINDIPVFDGKIGDIGLFYSLKDGMQYDIFPTMRSNSDLIRKTDFLLAEATPGDFLTISFDESDYGKIYFIGHDMSVHESNRILVANTLVELINAMYVK